MRLHKKIANIFGYELLRVKTKQPTVESHLTVLFEKTGINCVIDVGANVGQYGKMLRKNGYKGRIVSFEPVTSSYEILKEKSRTDNNWIVYKHALGARAESKKINITQTSHFSSFYKPNSYSQKKFCNDTILQNSETVEICKLETIFDQLICDIKNPKIFLKLDTQGFDLEVFRGAEGCIERIAGLQSEISMIPIYEDMPGYIESLTLFEAKGFKITGLYPVSREKNTLKLIELDCIMRKNI